MSDKRFSETERNCYYTSLVFDNKIQEKLGTTKAVDLLNEQQEQLDLYKEAILTMLGLLADKGIIFSGVKDELKLEQDFASRWQKESEMLAKENNQLRKQIQIYEQLISNSYVGEQETLDGWVGKYEIWETELQKYKEKIKGVCYEQ